MREQLVQAFRAMSGRHRSASKISRAATSGAARLVCQMEPLEDRQFLSTYYVSPSGSDSASGTSTSAPWKTVNRVNNQKLKAGDKILFKGGSSFSGSLYVPSAEGGNSSNPVVFSTYGSGRATINSGSKAGIDIAQTAGIAISNMNFVGSTSGSAPGIYLHVDWGNKDVSYFHVNNVEVRNYGREGILIKTSGGGSSLSAVKIEDASLHDNKYGGLKATGSSHNANKNWVIQHVTAYNNNGSGSTSSVTGSGIFVADAENVTIQRSVAHNNGSAGAAPVGIWVAGSNRVTIQYCESYNNNTKTGTDGGGFDFDWDVSNSVAQYNYSHGNAGPGYIMAAGTHMNSGNVLRYNVSENDGRKNGRAAIQLWGSVSNAQIYNNAVYISATGNSNTAAFNAHDKGSAGHEPSNVQIRNNIFQTTGGAKVLNITSGVAAKNGLKFMGNAYYSSGSSFKIQWGGSAYGSMSAWQSSKGQEKNGSTKTGYQGDPKLMNAGHGGTIGNADKLGSLTAYKLQGSSPLINRGQSQPGTLLSVIKTDFFGGSSLINGRYDIGIDEVA
jgi:hypothetical protein